MGFNTHFNSKNVVQVSVACVIGDWLNTPQTLSTNNNNHLNSIGKAFLRASLFSFGSICMGSLLCGFMQILRQLSEYLRPKRQESDPKQHILVFLQRSLLMFQECFCACIDLVGDKFNLWVFVYIGKCIHFCIDISYICHFSITILLINYSFNKSKYPM